MARIRGKDTQPEMVVRSLVHRDGFRFRLHRRDLPGTPDLVFPGLRSVIFVHGCFWHKHHCRKGTAMPASNRAFWRMKLEGNRDRDHRAILNLRRAHWRVLTIWECQLNDIEKLTGKLTAFLSAGKQTE